MQLVVTSTRYPYLLECWFECPLWVKSRHFATTLRMSAFGGKADIFQGVAECPLIAKSGRYGIYGADRDDCYPGRTSGHFNDPENCVL